MEKGGIIVLVALVAVLVLSAAAPQVSLAQSPDSKGRPLFLKSGTFTPSEKIPLQAQTEISALAQQKGRSHAVIQFDHIPTEAERVNLAN
ncbi:TPA: hypothetical protein H1009_00360, partial [archaeon]|nr:hypothetical protein [Candidatus Naiadarchaeales archaeon SRR2090153.bin461]